MSSAAGAARAGEPHQAQAVGPEAGETSAQHTVAGSPAAQGESSSEVAARSGAAAPEKRRVATVTGLRRLSVAAVLTSALAGVAGYSFVQSEAMAVHETAQTQVDTLQEALTAVDALGEDAWAPAGQAGAADEVRQASVALANASANAAAGPEQFAGDVGTLTQAAGEYAVYVDALGGVRQGADAATRAQEGERVTAERRAAVDEPLQQVQADTEQRLADARTGMILTSTLFGVSALAAVGVLLGGSVWLARRTRRVFNLGLSSAALLSSSASAYALTTVGSTAPALAAPAVLIGGVTAAGLAWAGLERRRKEYR